VVLKPAESTAAIAVILMETIGDLLPPGVVNIVTGYGPEAGFPLASSTRIAKIAFTGSTAVGKKIAAAAAANVIPCTLELGGKSPNIVRAAVELPDGGDATMQALRPHYQSLLRHSPHVSVAESLCRRCSSSRTSVRMH
jgi:aldehyde dehydrogenase